MTHVARGNGFKVVIKKFVQLFNKEWQLHSLKKAAVTNSPVTCYHQDVKLISGEKGQIS